MRFNLSNPLAFLRDNFIVAILAIPFSVIVSWGCGVSWWVTVILYTATLTLAYTVCCAKS